jgi:site-specific DNA-methyltransferase (adenine-specific)
MEEQKVMWVDPHTLHQNKVTNELYTSEPENFENIKENISQVGIREPLIVDTDNVVISGNMRLRIALELGIESVPVIYTEKSQINAKLLAVSHSQQRIKTYSELLKEYEILEAEYPVGKGRRTDLNPEMKKNKEKMKNLPISYAKINKLKNIKKYGEELYGKDSKEYKELWESVDNKGISLEKKTKFLKMKVEAKENLTKIPDTYEINTKQAKVYNHSCEYMPELKNGSIACIVTSPPYFQMRDNGTGADQRGLEKDVDSFVKGLIHDMSDCKRVLKDDGSLWVNLGEAVLDGHYNAICHQFVMAMMNEGWIFNDEIIWIKNNAIFTQAKRSVRAHEYIFHFVKNSNYYYDVSWLENVTDSDNRISFGTGGKIKNIISSMDFRENILRTNGNNMESLRKACKDAGFNLTHTSGFPLTVPLIAILTTSKENDTILDIYNGTGTSLEAAILANRKAVGYEIKPEYIMGSEVRLKPYLSKESDEDSKLVA